MLFDSKGTLIVLCVQLILLKTSGRIVYSGPLGKHSSSVIEYFEDCWQDIRYGLSYFAMEQTVMYREKFAGMYSPWAYALAQKIPKWWIWLYYLTPTSWTLNGMLTSQYGDTDKEITVFGETKPIGSFLEDYFRFHHDRLAITAVVLVAFPIVLASLFTYFIGRLNFLKR
ncbi:hypothetical protein Q3G72_032087 [Acer saccharum]|nr:hypothetical protein Q3G72_032087 [Acer saccharum]